MQRSFRSNSVSRGSVRVRRLAARTAPRPRTTIAALAAAVSVVSAVAVAGALGGWSPQASAEVPAAIDALRAGDCAAAGTAINDGLQRNDAQALFLAGYLYEATACVATDAARAAQFYRRAARLGSTEADEAMARLHASGRGVPQDYAASYRWHEAALSGRVDGDPSAAAGDPERDRLAGYSIAVARLARTKAAYPLRANDRSMGATLEAVLDPATGTVTVRNVRTGVEIGSSRTMAEVFVEAVTTAYAAAVAELPPLAGSGDAKRDSTRYATPWRFAMRRTNLDRAIDHDGEVTIGEPVPWTEP